MSTLARVLLVLLSAAVMFQLGRFFIHDPEEVIRFLTFGTGSPDSKFLRGWVRLSGYCACIVSVGGFVLAAIGLALHL